MYWRTWGIVCCLDLQTENNFILLFRIYWTNQESVGGGFIFLLSQKRPLERYSQARWEVGRSLLQVCSSLQSVEVIHQSQARRLILTNYLNHLPAWYYQPFQTTSSQSTFWHKTLILITFKPLMHFPVKFQGFNWKFG